MWQIYHLGLWVGINTWWVIFYAVLFIIKLFWRSVAVGALQAKSTEMWHFKGVGYFGQVEETSPINHFCTVIDRPVSECRNITLPLTVII